MYTTILTCTFENHTWYAKLYVKDDMIKNNHYNHREFLRLMDAGASSLVLVTIYGCKSTSKKQPNILLIFTDDQGDANFNSDGARRAGLPKTKGRTNIGLNNSETTIAEMLKPLGYTTACIGGGAWDIGLIYS